MDLLKPYQKINYWCQDRGTKEREIEIKNK